MNIGMASAIFAPRGLGRWRLESEIVPVTLILPAILVILLVLVYPVFDAAVLSVYRTHYAAKVAFVGLDNYVSLARDPMVWNATVNSLIYTIGSLILVMPLGLGLALLLNGEVPFQSLVRTIVIIPWVVSQTVVALLWAWLISADFGPLTYLVEQVVGIKPALLSSPVLAMTTLIVVNVWASYPQATLLLLAAIQTVPRDLREAAGIDGASRIRAFWHVTLPLIRPTIIVVLIQLTLLYFNMVTLIYVFTGGGPLDATETLAVRVLKVSFEDWHLGRGAALGLMITVLNLVFSLTYLRILKVGRR